MADIEIIGVAVRKRITWPTEREPMAVGLQWPNYADYSTKHEILYMTVLYIMVQYMIVLYMIVLYMMVQYMIVLNMT